MANLQKTPNVFVRIFRAILNTPSSTNRVKAQFMDSDTPMVSSDEMVSPYMLSFRENQFNTGMVVNESSIDIGPPNEGSAEGRSKDKEKATRIPVKPIDVLAELERIPTNWDLNALDDKIAMLKEKEKLINQRHAKREVLFLISALESRKKYDEYRAYFTRFDATNEEKIEVLLKKYELVMESADIFIPEFPDTAVLIMKEYTEKVKEITGAIPRLYVIAPLSAFKKAFGKRDPILLAQSPFGFYYYILGAYDKEMQYLPEL